MRTVHTRLAARVIARAVLGILVAAMLLVTTLLEDPAQAAPGEAFPAGDPLVFVAQNAPTQLYKATTNSSGAVSFAAEGGPSSISYNAIGYNSADNYLYGIVSSPGFTGYPTGAVVRVGQGGVVTRVGTNVNGSQSFNIGAFGPNGNFYATASNLTTMNVINPTTGALVQTVTLSAATNVADMAYANGFFWGLVSGSATIPSRFVRINPTSGAVTTFAATLPFGAYGAAWTFGNGNLGFSENTSGVVTQVRVTNPGSAAPTFTTVATSPGPASGQNDGAASPGQPTDLAIHKTGPAALTSGGSISYSLTVTNNGPGNSSGFVVTDTVPAPLTNIATTSPACTITGRDVRCVGGRLLANGTVSYTVTASVPANVTASITNTATVTANEVDPTPANNSDSTTAVISGLSILKRAGVPVDVNGNGITDEGDTIQFSFDVTNTGDVTMTGLVVNDPLAGDVSCPSTTLAVDATQTCTADELYTITAADETAAAVNNSATVTGTTPDGNDVTSAPSTTSTPVTAADPGISLVKSVVPVGLTDYVVGQTIDYSFLVSNTGNVPLEDATVDEVDFTGSGAVSEIDCPAAIALIPVGAQVTCTASYVTTQNDVDAGSITNTATASGTPPGDPEITSEPSTAVVTTTVDAALTLLKSVSPTWITRAGESVEYAFVVTNTGNVTLSDAIINETAFSGTGPAPVASCPAGAASLAPGASVTCTAGYTATQADVDARIISNTAVADASQPDGTGVFSEPSSADVSVFVITLPLTGGTSTEQLLLVGGAAVLVAIILAILHHLHHASHSTRQKRTSS